MLHLLHLPAGRPPAVPHVLPSCTASGTARPVPQDALDMSLKLALSIPLTDILAYRQDTATAAAGPGVVAAAATAASCSPWRPTAVRGIKCGSSRRMCPRSPCSLVSPSLQEGGEGLLCAARRAVPQPRQRHRHPRHRCAAWHGVGSRHGRASPSFACSTLPASPCHVHTQVIISYQPLHPVPPRPAPPAAATFGFLLSSLDAGLKSLDVSISSQVGSPAHSTRIACCCLHAGPCRTRSARRCRTQHQTHAVRTNGPAVDCSARRRWTTWLATTSSTCPAARAPPQQQQ